MRKEKVHSFAVGAMIITLGMLSVKIFGALFKIPLMALLGGEGNGYFNGAYNFYSPIYAIATAGLPIAVSRMVSENVALGRYRDVRRLYSISTPVFIIMGGIGFIFVILGAFLYSNLAKSPGSLYSIFMLAPSLFFSCLTSTYRGYYEGLRNMTPTAVSEVIESIGKVVFGLSFAYLTDFVAMRGFYDHGIIFGHAFENIKDAKAFVLPFSSAAAVLGITVGAFCAFVYVYFRHKIKGDGITCDKLANSPKPKGVTELLSLLFKIAVPVVLGAIVMNLAGVVDSILIQRRLADIAENNIERLVNFYGGILPNDVVLRGATHIFLAGCFGYTSTIVMFLPTIAQGIAISTLPTATAVWVSGDKKKIKRNIETIIKIASIVSMPMGIGLSVLARPIVALVYSWCKPYEISIAAGIMAISGIGAVFIALSTPVCSMLHAIGRPDLPVKIISLGMIIKVILNYILVGIPEINIQGAGIGTLVCYVFVFFCVFRLLQKNARVMINTVMVFFKPAIASILCAVAAHSSFLLLVRVLNEKISVIISVLFSSFVYFIAILCFKTITRNDLESLPKGKKLAKIFGRFLLH